MPDPIVVLVVFIAIVACLASLGSSNNRKAGRQCNADTQCKSSNCLANHCCKASVLPWGCSSCSSGKGECDLCEYGYHMKRNTCVEDTTTTTITTTTVTTTTERPPCLADTYEGPFGGWKGIASNLIWNAGLVDDALACADLCLHWNGSSSVGTDSSGTQQQQQQQQQQQSASLGGCVAFALQTSSNNALRRKCRLYNSTASTPAVRSDGSLISGATFYFQSKEQCTPTKVDAEKIFFEVGFAVMALFLCAISAFAIKRWKQNQRDGQEAGTALLGATGGKHNVKIQQNCTTAATPTVTVAQQLMWQWEGDVQHDWNMYSERDCTKLNAYAASRGDAGVVVLNHKYRVDLATMKQLNAATGYARRVRRCCPTASPPSSTRPAQQPAAAQQSAAGRSSSVLTFPSVAFLPPLPLPARPQLATAEGLLLRPGLLDWMAAGTPYGEEGGKKWMISRCTVTADAMARRKEAGANAIVEIEAQHFELALGKFALHGGCSDKVYQVDVYDCPHRTLQFAELQRQFHADGKSNNKDLHWAFHGTTPQAAADIMTAGFKVGGTAGVAIRNGDVHGRGVYTARTATTAVKYAGKSGTVVLAHAIPGIQGKTFSETAAGHAAMVDSWTPNSDWVVFRTGQQLLPVYALHLKR